MNQYLLIAYVVGLGLLWGATLHMWMTHRALSRRKPTGREQGSTP